MFIYFFNDYKELLSKMKKKLPWREWLFILIPTAIPITMIVISILTSIYGTRLIIFICLSMLVFIMWYFLLNRYYNKKEKSQRKERLDKYTNSVIHSLMALLESEEYNLYTAEGISWLTKCSMKRLSSESIKSPLPKGISIFIIYLLSPVLVALISASANEAGVGDTFVYVLALSFVLVLVFIMWISLRPIFFDFIYPDEEKYKQLIEDLAYIQTQLPKICLKTDPSCESIQHQDVKSPLFENSLTERGHDDTKTTEGIENTHIISN
jgi:ABC-type transport system involved in cytochrome bd biosynthesis fused ATPase/permease subunit